jgi:4-carboxymuconolactone decarboxylase
MRADDARSGAPARKTPGAAGLLAASAVLLSLSAMSRVHAQEADIYPSTHGAVRMVAPALERYEQGALFGNLWRRPDLSPRDRSLVTLAALVARNQAAELPRYLDLALDSGVKPGEISEVITHLAFYAGWGNAMAAVPAVRDVFAQRGIGAEQLPAASPDLVPLDQVAEAQRAARVGQDVRPVAPGLDQFTTDVLFRDLWLRPGLAPRDRSLVTVSALIAAGQVAQVPYHLNRAMDNGLTGTQAGEVVTHLAFYAGWPNAFSAAPVLKSVFEGRGASPSSGKARK